MKEAKPVACPNCGSTEFSLTDTGDTVKIVCNNCLKIVYEVYWSDLG